MLKATFDTKGTDFVSYCMRFIIDELNKLKLEKKIVLKTELLCEEAILKLSKCAPEGASIQIAIRRSITGTAIELKALGEEIEELSGGGNINYVAQAMDNMDEKMDTGFLILKANEKVVKYSHINGMNLIRIKVAKSEQSAVALTLLSLVVSTIIAILFRKFLPGAVSVSLCNYVFIPIRTMFINALKMVVGPVVFFSIVTCISQFTNLSELGKIGAKIFAFYTFTTFVAVGVGFGMFYLLQPGKWGNALLNSPASTDIAINTDADTSIINVIVNIIPANLLEPFVKSNTLQIIFLAILLGIAVGMIGSYSKLIKNIFEACNELFITVTAMIAKFIPLAVFCSMFIMITNAGMDSMMEMLEMMSTDILALLVMMVIYGILILFIGRLNPITFFRKNLPGMINAFTLASSNASMPMNIKICTEKMGISPKVCNFSIPLGATVNMDGVSVHLAVASMFLAKMYAVEVPQSAMVSIVITIVLLSLGTPGVSGASLVCLGVLLNQMGVPIEAIGLIMGVDAIIDMCRTVSNTTGDMAVTLIVARLEKLLDIDVYKS